jgi:hypothetical protein
MARAEDEPYHRSFLSPTYEPILRREQVEEQAIESFSLDPVQGNVYRPGSPPGLPDFVKRKGDLKSVEAWFRKHPGVGDSVLVKGLERANRPPMPAPPSKVTNGLDLWFQIEKNVARPKPLVRHQAFVDGAERLVSLQEKDDQQFNEFAHDWEKNWSTLVLGAHAPFTPVVDRTWKVVGYRGGVKTGHAGALASDPGNRAEPILCVPARFKGTVDELGKAMDNGVVVFVHSLGTMPDGWAPMDAYTTEHEVAVRTTIDGEVIGFQVISSGDLVQPWYSPSDIYNAAKILASLGKLGIIWTSSLMCKMSAKLEARAILKGATALLARESEEKAAKSIPRAVVEKDLIPLANRTRGASRLLTTQQMEAHLRDVLRTRPYLARLRTVTNNDGLMKLIKEWEEQTGGRFLIVSKGAVQKLESQGVGGWAIDTVSRRTVLVIEEQVFNDTQLAIREVTHELAYEALWEGQNYNVPFLEGAANHVGSGLFWLEGVIQQGAPVWDALRATGQR